MNRIELLNNAINVYYFGSYIYGTYSELSDKDYVVVVPDGNYPEQLHFENEDFNIFTESQWIKMVENNDIEVLETLFLDGKYIIKHNKDYPCSVKPDLVRKTISHISSNSFVKCKKKLTIQKDFDPRNGKKSLWHSLRLLMFGIQIMEKGFIYDYTVANVYYDDIVNNPNNDWNYYKENYKPIYNKLHSQFKIAHSKV